MNVLAVYPGRFHPFHKGHKYSFVQLAKQFGLQNTFLAISKKVEPPSSPFDPMDRVKMAMATGIPKENITVVADPYGGKQYTKLAENMGFDPANTILVFAVSKKDMEGDPSKGIEPDQRFSFKPLKSGKPSYYQPISTKDKKSMLEHAYIMSTEVLEFPILGNSTMDASAIRALYIKSDEQSRNQILVDMYGKNAKHLKSIFEKTFGTLTESIKSIVTALKPLLSNASSEKKGKIAILLENANKTLMEVFDNPYKLTGTLPDNAYIKNVILQLKSNPNVNSVMAYAVEGDPSQIFFLVRHKGAWEVHHSVGGVSGQLTSTHHGANTRWVGTAIHLYIEKLNRGKTVRVVCGEEYHNLYSKIIQKITKHLDQNRNYEISDIDSSFEGADGDTYIAQTIGIPAGTLRGIFKNVNESHGIKTKKNTKLSDYITQTVTESKEDFDTSKVWYHGTTSPTDFKQFKIGKGGFDELGKGIYVTSNPDMAAAWAGRPGHNGRIMPLYIRKGELVDGSKINDSFIKDVLVPKIKALYPPESPEYKLQLAAENIRNNKHVTKWSDEDKKIINAAGQSGNGWMAYLIESDDALYNLIKNTSLIRSSDNSRELSGINYWLSIVGYIGKYNPNSQIPGQLCVFKPGDIKSAIGNNGKYKGATLVNEGSDNLPNENSLGKPIANNPESLKNFWNWFGNSKVVDSSSKPMVVYHGTSESFSTFDKNKLGSFTGAPSAKEGFFFGSSRENSESYVRAKGFDAALKSVISALKEAKISFSARRFDSNAALASQRLITPNLADVKKLFDSGETIIDAFVGAMDIAIERFYSGAPNNEQNMRAMASATRAKKMAISFLQGNTQVTDTIKFGSVMELYLNIENPYIRDDSGHRKFGFADDIMMAKKLGHDGVIFRNTKDPLPTDVFVVFSENKIKSATGNNGRFSPTNPNITESIQLKSEMIDHHSGQSDFQITATENDAIVGTLRYTVYNDEVSINIVHVPRKDRRKGIARQMLQHLQREYPNSEIQWGYTTDKGAELKKSVTSEIPNDNEELNAKSKQLRKVANQIERLQKIADTIDLSDNMTPEKRAKYHKLMNRWNDLSDLEWDLRNELHDYQPTKTMIKLDESSDYLPEKTMLKFNKPLKVTKLSESDLKSINESAAKESLQKLCELDYTDEVSGFNLTDDQLNSFKHHGYMDTMPISYLLTGNSLVLAIMDNSKMVAGILLDMNGELHGAENKSKTKGLVSTLMTYALVNFTDEIIISHKEMVSNDGIKWLTGMTKGTHFKLSDSDGNDVTAKQVLDAWESAKNTREQNDFGLTISLKQKSQVMEYIDKNQKSLFKHIKYVNFKEIDEYGCW